MKKLVLIALILAIATASVAQAAGTYTIRISPFWPNAVESPAIFETWVEGGSGDAYNPKILVVLTKACYDGLSGLDPVTLTHSPTTIPIQKAAFVGTADNSEQVPTGMTAAYTVASLQDHLGTDDAIYWALADAPFTGPLTGTHVEFTVTISSSDVRALVFVMGSSSEASSDLDMGVPPTPAGFLVPEPATIAATAAAIGAFGLYAFYRKRKP